MSLFQQSVLNKYLEALPKEQVYAAWGKFTSHFQNHSTQQNISNLREEEYQEGFLRDLFVKVLGYTLKPQPEYNLVLEQKSTSDTTKSDGAIITNGMVTGVIELKDTRTADLKTVEKQAFGYKHQHKDCRYVIISNFRELRLYINDAVEFESFDLFYLDKASFDIMYCCLHQVAIEKDVPSKMKQLSIAEEENVTKKLYADYSRFRSLLYANITSINPQFDRLELFKKTQKLLDRFLFILFAEDRSLLTPNSVRIIMKQWQALKDMDSYVPLYERFKRYFGYMNSGYTGKDFEVYPYNGGLFAPDEVLDTISIDDNLLYDSCMSLSNYNFMSEVDVNILGHIFEHSLTEFEKIQKELETDPETPSRALEKNQTRRKKEGVYYTPRYITKYIVENTVGTLCQDKKAEMQIIDDEYIPQKKKADTQRLVQKLEDYRNWLLQLTICDPACGSGAFLNQALEFLIQEHHNIDALKAKILGTSFFGDVEKSILENNLFGVDINEEAVEIAKLSLWLRTAQRNRKLSDLSRHIKCGNSFIDDPAVGGDKAFNWQNEFPEVFEKGGFDVVIGNPPYVDIKALPNDTVEYIFSSYETSNNRINLFSVFVEKSLQILKEEGKFSFIIPSSLLTQESYKLLRSYLLSNASINSIVRLPNESFGGSAGEVKVDTIILTFTNSTRLDHRVEVLIYKGFERISEITPLNTDEYLFLNQSIWSDDSNSIFRINTTSDISEILKKIEDGSVKCIDCAEFCLGLTPYDKYKGHTPDQIANRAFHATFQKDNTYKKLLAGNDVRRYHVHWNGDEWISYGKWLGAPRDEKFFKEKRILVKQIIDWTDKKIWAAVTEEELYNTQNSFNLIASKDFYPEYIASILNSKLISFYHRKKFLEEYKDRFQKILIKDCKEFPIKRIPKDKQLEFTQRVQIISDKYRELYELQQRLLKLLSEKYGDGTSRKLQDWPSLTFKEFLKEMEKQKIKLTLSEQSEWMQYFEAEKVKANDIKNLIDRTDKEIDQMVYALYGLTEEEVRVVDGKL